MDSDRLARYCTDGMFLVLLGLAAYHYLLPADRRFRDVYSRAEDCHADWGDAQPCESEAEAGSHRLRWYGPEYGPGEREALTAGRDHSIAVMDVTDGKSRARLVSRADTVRQSGFGSSGWHFSGGG